MSVRINRDGLDSLIKNTDELDGQHQVKLVDLMHPDFVSSHSAFPDLSTLFAASGFKIDSTDDFAAIPDDEWNAFIKANTDFDSWLEMQRTAGTEYMKSRLLNRL